MSTPLGNVTVVRLTVSSANSTTSTGATVIQIQRTGTSGTNGTAPSTITLVLPTTFFSSNNSNISANTMLVVTEARPRRDRLVRLHVVGVGFMWLVSKSEGTMLSGVTLKVS